jgi:hypothetical protein
MPPDRFSLLADELISDVTTYLHSITRDSGQNAPVNRSVLALACCNKRLRCITLPLVYCTVEITRLSSLDSFLLILIETPDYALLVQDLTLGIDRVEELCRIKLGKFIDEFRRRGLPEEVTLGIKGRHPWANSLLLLHLLQNLEVLRIVSGLRCDAKFGFWLTGLLHEGIVSRRLLRFSWEDYDQLDIGTFLPILLLPSIVEIRGDAARSITSLDHHWSLPSGFQLSSHFGTSNVERLEMHNAEVRSKDLATVLRLPRNLKCLVYKRQIQRYRDETAILDRSKAALNHVMKSLEYLTIEWHYDEHPIEDSSSIWSFLDFKSLKALCINHHLICKFNLDTVSHTALSLPPTLEILGTYAPYGRWLSNRAYIGFWMRLLNMKSSTCLTRLRLIASLRGMEVLSDFVDFARKYDAEVALTTERLKSEGIIW